MDFATFKPDRIRGTDGDGFGLPVIGNRKCQLLQRNRDIAAGEIIFSQTAQEGFRFIWVGQQP